MRPTLSYAVLDAGASLALLGIVVAAFAVPALLLALPVGHVIDRVGERPSLIVGSISLLASALVAALAAGSVVALLAATVLLGVGHLLSVIGEQAIVANTTRRGHYDSQFGYYSFAAALGQTIGPVLLALPGGVSRNPPIETIFILCGGLSIALLFISVFMRSSVRAPIENRPRMLPSALALLRMPGVLRALMAGSIVLASVDLFLAYLPALGQDRKITALAISAILVVRSMFSMFSRLFLGPSVRLLGRRRLMVSTIAVSAIALSLFAIPLPVAGLVALAGVYGFAIGTCQPITMSWISELATRGNRGLAMSLRLASNRLGQTALPSVLGALASATGAAGVFIAAGIALIGAAWSSASIGAAGTEDNVPDVS